MKKFSTRCVGWFLPILFTVQPSFAQDQSAHSLAEEAEKYFQAKDWTNAAIIYEKIAKQEPSYFQAWNRLGSSLLRMAKYEQAVRACEQAVALNNNNPFPKYNLVCAYARMNEKDKAFAVLAPLAATGFFRADQLLADEDFANLRTDSRFDEVLAAARKSTQPCTVSPEFRQLDFWIGEWEVQSNGQPAGSSSVQLILGDCVIFENWTGVRGVTGKSFNIYDSVRGKWKQTWVSDRGVITEFVGEFKDNKMEYLTEVIGADGNKRLRRMTLFNLGPDRVRQFSEGSMDGGKTWNVEYDFVYIRRK